MKHDIAAILETFVQITPKELANPEHWVLIDTRTGKHLQLRSKKKNWNRIGHAKSALLLHMFEVCQSTKKWDERLSDKEVKALTDTLLREGHIKLVNLLAKPEEKKKKKQPSPR